jgi:anthranilate synthase/phosphoribosyltransferase
MLKKILLLDNFDSFTYNLVDFFRQLGCEVKVYRNTAEPEQLAKEDFDLLVLSPGPSIPRNAGNMMRVIERFYQIKPILGVCLGHQALIEHFGGKLSNIAPVHGKSVPIKHDGRGIFTGIEQNCKIARYHSWAGTDIPTDFEVSATSEDGTVMAIRHKKLPIEAIQFHPESVLSMTNNIGMRMLKNIVDGRISSGNRIYHELAQKLQSSQQILDAATLREFLRTVEEGQLSEDQKQILLVSLSHRLRNTSELKVFIDVLMEFSTTPLRFSEAMDVCGTGGSGLPRINTSTLASMLLAHEGLKIAKHGNRAAAGRYGSFNLLENLGIPLKFSLASAHKTLDKTNLAFLFAPEIHPIFRHFAPVRAKIGVPTIFNILGPLVNPCLPERQFIGTAFADMMEVIFETAIKMGKKHVIVVRAWDGLDEISLSAPTRILEYKDGKKNDYEVSPVDFGLEIIPFSALSAATSEECLALAQNIINGNPKTEHWKLVAANAAFIYSKFVEPLPLPLAFKKMEKLIFEGTLGKVLSDYKQAMGQVETSNVS